MTSSDIGVKDANHTTDSSLAVYITTKNRRAMLDRAVNSVLRQSIKPDEIIIVDDGSTDDTARYLETVSEADASITVITNKTSMGACKARNIAISRAKSRYITGLDDDDEFTRNRLKDFIDAAAPSLVLLGNPALLALLGLVVAPGPATFLVIDPAGLWRA